MHNVEPGPPRTLTSIVNDTVAKAARRVGLGSNNNITHHITYMLPYMLMRRLRLAKAAMSGARFPHCFNVMFCVVLWAEQDSSSCTAPATSKSRNSR